MSHSQNLNYEFGPYSLNPALLRLTREGEKISLTPKAVEILALLVSNAGQLVAKDFLLKEVWPNTFVEDANLAQNIFLLRRALGDERSGPKYIETVARRGYRFIASVRVFDAEDSDGESVESETEAKDGNAAGSKRIVIAVLPFVNATGDPNVEYLSEGVADNIINNLARVSQLRVMSRSAVFRHSKDVFDPLVVGRELGAKAVLVGQISVRPAGIAIGVELVEVAKGWQLWGETFDCELKDILEIQDTITRQLLVNLKLKLTGEEEKRITARYTENAEAYQAYLEGRYHWSLYTRTGIEKAIGHFRQAIELDPNYALAYAAIVDCYLRLTTNYLPPEGDIYRSDVEEFSNTRAKPIGQYEERIKLRFKWDWNGIERELRRANELRTNYPSIHQWYVAYRRSRQLYRESAAGKQPSSMLETNFESRLTSQIPSIGLTPAEEVQILCSIARDQMAIGNYEAARLILQQWCVPGTWPKLDYLNAYAAADLLFTIGSLLGSIAGSKQVVHGHRHAEALLNGSVALFEQLGVKTRSVEARMELTRCYYRQGLLDIARETILAALAELPADQLELKTLALINLGVIERDSGRLKDSLVKLREAASLEVVGRLVTGRCNIDLATTLKDLAFSHGEKQYLAEAKSRFLRALYESEALGHHRNVGSVENNFGFLLLNLGAYKESELHLLRANRIFNALCDNVRGAQVKDTLARLYIETKQHAHAEQVIDLAVEILECTDSEAILAEALTTKGIVACRAGRHSEGKRSFEAAYKVAERCGDHQGVVRALLGLFEEMRDRLDEHDRRKIAHQLMRLVPAIQQPSLLARAEHVIAQFIAKGDAP
ncbi:MAG TPA: winged helix-turn-helix domain-containing protein [Pyrinomonadaceae bacterium]|nr:winged helix-turn-helix domain-containing protein [Pyrinomonadaceae bacterium]